MNRRRLLAAAAGAAAVPAFGATAQVRPRVVVVGGGYGGASVARTLRRLDPAIQVTLVERDQTFFSCPGSNAVLGGLAGIESIRFDGAGLRRAGIALVHDRVTAIDPDRRRLTLSNGSLEYDRLVLSPGVDFVWGGVPGYDEAAAEVMPHAWRAGAQTLLLRQKLMAMEDGGLVVMAVPADPYRCPPGPYERASLMAHYLKREKPRSKILILDAKDGFSKQALFQEAWQALYPGMIEWVPASRSGRVRSVDVGAGTVSTDFDDHRPAVANIIPPQRAGALAAPFADAGGFCRVDPTTFESAVARGVHIVGDAIAAGDMPKSAFSANAQGKACARALVALLREAPAPETALINTCYSLAAPAYGFSIAGVYKPQQGALRLVRGSGGTSPLAADPATRRLEAQYANSWFQHITTDLFG